MPLLPDDNLTKDQLLAQVREFRAVFDLSPNPMLIVDSSGLIRQVNAAAADLGGGEQNLLNKRGGDALRCFQHLNSSHGCGLSPECHTCTLRRTVVDTMTTGKSQKGVFAEMKLLNPAGNWDNRKLLLSTTPLYSTPNPQILVCLEDITEKFHAQAVLLASERLARSTLNSLSAHIAIVNQQGLIQAVNQSWRDFALANGLHSQSVSEGANYFAACEHAIQNHAENAAEFLHGLRQVLAGQLPHFSLEYPCHSPNEKRWFLACITHFPSDTGPCAVIAHENITARKLSEDALRASQEKFASAFHLCPDAITITRIHDGAYLEVSDGFTRLLGYSREEVLGKSPLPHDLNVWLHPEDRQKWIHALSTHGQVLDMESDFRTKDGRIVSGLISARFIDFAGEKCLLTFTRDITERKRAQEALRQSEQRLQLALNGGQMGMWEWDIPANQSKINAKEYELLGLPLGSGQLPTETIYSHIHPHDATLMRQVLADLLKDGTHYKQEFRIIHDNGTTRWLNAIGQLTRDADGKPLRLIGVNFDITERKLAENALRASEEQYRLLFSEMLNAFALHEIICDQNGTPVDYRFLDVNPAFEKFTGLKRDDLIGKTVLQVLPATEKHWIELYGNVALTRKGLHFENYSQALGKYFEGVAYSPAPLQFATIFDDVTARRLTQEAIQTSQANLTALIENTAGMAWSIDSSYRLITSNEEFRKIVRSLFHHDIALGDDVLAVLGDDRLIRQWRSYYDRALSGERFRVELPNFSSSIPRQDEFYLNPIRNPDGRITGVTIFGYDISERIRAQTLAAQNQARAAHLARLNTMGQLSTGLAHELNQPLAAIVNFVHYCQSILHSGKPGSVSLADALAAIDREAKRAGDIIWRLRSFIRKQEPQRSSTNANDLIHECLALLNTPLKQNRIHIDLHLDPNLPLVMLDPIQIQQVLVNLVQNAIDAMAPLPLEQRRLQIHTVSSPNPDRISIHVIDHGPGIPHDKLHRIFDEFFTTKPDGLGLGLAISKSIVESHHGSLQARPNSTHGMTFECSLPLKHH